ncbi:MAG: ATP synthase F1 subunit gamma [Bacteroidetes bacterium]|nr:ATP synthase F1 subunit gamma [Bacteroidota bacterium]
MSGKLKEVRTRISSVTSTQQITKAMKVVSAAKLRKAQDAILRMRPYAVKMTSILANLAEATKGEVNIPQAEARPVRKVLIVAITSDRGLCGGFNANVIKQVRLLARTEYADQSIRGDLHIMPIGKKSADAFKRNDFPLILDFAGMFSGLSFEKSKEAADYLKTAFADGRYDRVVVVYNSFKNAATQILSVEQFLPISKFDDDKKGASTTQTEFIFEPDRETMVAELVPRILNTQFFRYLLDSNAAEHGARMTAMDKATDNAGELLKELKISYNRARQAAITTELTEIVSGAAALSEG